MYCVKIESQLRHMYHVGVPAARLTGGPVVGMRGDIIHYTERVLTSDCIVRALRADTDYDYDYIQSTDSFQTKVQTSAVT